MYISSFKIQDFKSVVNLELHLDRQFSILTGVNNCGKTTILEALALWAECFGKLLNEAQRSVTGRYQKGDYILGPTSNRYFNFDEIYSVRCPNFEDMFRDRNTKLPIVLSAELVTDDGKQSMTVGFSISSSTNTRYVISLDGKDTFDYNKFNTFFRNLNNGSIAYYYASPVALIEQMEDFVTDPVLNDAIHQRHSYQVIRNRIYKLYHSSSAVFQTFQNDMSFVLYGTSTSAKLILSSKSDIQKDKRVIITYKIDNEIVEKDIALLGSGSLQVMEILLDVYHQSDEKKDLNLVLLDEPDSHIHRDIQGRLLKVLNSASGNNQVVVTTHNESLIRSASLSQLFHIDGSGKGVVSCLYKKELPKLNTPHYTGPYPTLSVPVIRSIDSTAAGLDFISAIEADKIVFVEGDDDARLLYKLFSAKVANRDIKIMFWVLGGITKIMDKVDMYKLFFGEIKNRTSLWDKSLLVFDMDRLLPEHYEALSQVLQEKKKLPNMALTVYTQESILLSDVGILTQLLMRYLKEDALKKIDVEHELQVAIESRRVVIKERYSDGKIDNGFVQEYKGMYIEKINKMLDNGRKIVVNDIDLRTRLIEYYDSVDPITLSTKEDVEAVINSALSALRINKSVDETFFYSLVEQSDRSTFYPEWERLVGFLG